jgi:hypothetical protein
MAGPRGAQVRKGEKSTTVVFWKFANNSCESQDGDESTPAASSRLLFTRGYPIPSAYIYLLDQRIAIDSSGKWK